MLNSPCKIRYRDEGNFITNPQTIIAMIQVAVPRSVNQQTTLLFNCGFGSVRTCIQVLLCSDVLCSAVPCRIAFELFYQLQR